MSNVDDDDLRWATCVLYIKIKIKSTKNKQTDNKNMNHDDLHLWWSTLGDLYKLWHTQRQRWQKTMVVVLLLLRLACEPY